MSGFGQVFRGCGAWMLVGASVVAGGCASCPPRMSGNPIVRGWYADPDSAVLEGRYWVYPTLSAPYDDQLRFDAFSSEDLVEWERHEGILSAEDVSWARRAMWAPCIAAVPADAEGPLAGKYALFFAANDIQSNDELGGIGVAVSDSPGGPFEDWLGRPLVDRFHNGAQPIDQAAFRRATLLVLLVAGLNLLRRALML